MRLIIHILSLVVLVLATCANVNAKDRNKNVVNIIAPSCKGNKENLPSIREYIESLGMQANIEEDIYNYDSNLIYSNYDEFRARDLINALTDDSQIVWCIRGGKGATKLIPYLEKLSESQKRKIEQNRGKKILIGNGDTTTLHIYLNTKYDWYSLHAPTLESIVEERISSDSRDKLELLLSGYRDHIKFNDLRIVDSSIELKDGVLESKIVGGNIGLIRSSIGTDWQIDTKGKILFLEDFQLDAGMLERDLEHLRQAHLLDDVQALILGDVFAGKDINLEAAVKENFARSVNFPVFIIRGIGTRPTSAPLPLNTYAVITQRGNSFSLTVHMPTEWRDN